MDEREKIKAALEQGSKAFSAYFRSELRKALDGGKGHFGTRDTKKTVVDFIADTLIAANIGDVTEWKERAKKAEERLEKQVAERALSWLCDETMRDIRIIMYPSIGKQVRDKQELYDHCIEQAEREIEEEEER